MQKLSQWLNAFYDNLDALIDIFNSSTVSLFNLLNLSNNKTKLSARIAEMMHILENETALFGLCSTGVHTQFFCLGSLSGHIQKLHSLGLSNTAIQAHCSMASSSSTKQSSLRTTSFILLKRLHAAYSKSVCSSTLQWQSCRLIASFQKMCYCCASIFIWFMRACSFHWGALNKSLRMIFKKRQFWQQHDTFLKAQSMLHCNDSVVAKQGKLNGVLANCAKCGDSVTHVATLAVH